MSVDMSQMETPRQTLHVLVPVGASLGDVGQMDFSRMPSIYWKKLHPDFDSPRIYLLGFLKYVVMDGRVWERWNAQVGGQVHTRHYGAVSPLRHNMKSVPWVQHDGDLWMKPQPDPLKELLKTMQKEEADAGDSDK